MKSHESFRNVINSERPEKQNFLVGEQSCN